MLFFLEFSITERNENFYFLSLVDLFHLILAWNEPTMVFFFFFSLFLEFCISRRVGTERNGNTIFIFALSRPFPTFFDLKRSHNGYFYFLNFFTIFFELSLMPRVGTKRNDNFYFLSFAAYSNLFWLEKKPSWVFLFFDFFYNFFWIISYASCRNETKRLFLFSLF